MTTPLERVRIALDRFAEDADKGHVVAPEQIREAVEDVLRPQEPTPNGTLVVHEYAQEAVQAYVRWPTGGTSKHWKALIDGKRFTWAELCAIGKPVQLVARSAEWETPADKYAALRAGALDLIKTWRGRAEGGAFRTRGSLSADELEKLVNEVNGK